MKPAITKLATLAASLIALTSGVTFAQTADRPAYEAAEIEVNTSGDDSSHSDGTLGQIIMTNQTLKRLIERAYNSTPVEVTGPDWLDKVRFDIVAKYPPNSTAETRPLMLRTLLEERLKLTVHRESKELPGYALTVAKGGFKLQHAASGPSATHSNGSLVRGLTATNVSMTRLATFLTQSLGQTVIDKTGITGGYDFELKWTTDEIAAANENVSADAEPTLFNAPEDRLGLRLQAQKVPVDIIVVDHVERVPTE